EKRYLVWEKGRKVRWFYQEFVLPKDLNGYPLDELTLRLALTWWAEFAEVYVNNQKVQEGDLFDHSCRVVLSSNVLPGEKITVAIRLVSPGHDIGGLMRSRLIYESNYSEIDPGFVADELEVIQTYINAFELEEPEIEFDWKILDRASFNQSLEALRNSLLPFSSQIKRHTIYLLGHAHLDMAWLWDVEETWKAAERTFISVLNLQKDFPELTFCHTTPALFEWIEQNRPELFAQIQTQVKAGKWEIVGGMWVEPEMNLINGESIARHLLYGQRYCEEKFGEICRVAWLPDTFGFNWQTPQFLKLAGIDYFVTQKLRWNDTTQFPHEWLNWQAPDGSQVKSLMSSPIGEGIDPIKMANFTWDWTKKTEQLNPLWLFGVGDHGGGPTRDMLEIAQRWTRSPFFPKLEFTTALSYLESLEAPRETWNDELYLEFHRGCYTTHGDQKKLNRDCESLLYQAELWASLAKLSTQKSYPRQELETARKKALLNQFHDILPGTSIAQVFADANREWFEVKETTIDIQSKSCQAIADQIKLSPPPHPAAEAIVIFNAHNWEVTEYHSIRKETKNWQILDETGQPLKHQEYAQEFSLLKFLAKIPPLGYRCFWLCPDAPEDSTAHSISDDFVLENEFLRATIDSKTGDLISLFDRTHQYEVLNDFGNRLQAFQDEGQYWDAWNINPAYAQYPLPIQLNTIEFSASSAYSISVDRTIGKSEIKQIYSLKPNTSHLEIATDLVDWQERHVLLKTAFQFNLTADYVTYEIPCGAIERTTIPKNPAEKAKWEVPALGWVDLNDGKYGVSLLSSCKHGYDCQPNQIRLTLLRGSGFPDPKADLGHHHFTYAIYPHAGNWKEAQTVRRSQAFRNPLTAIVLDSIPENGTLPPVHSFLDLQSENLIVSSLKQSEDHPDDYILRCYECHGEPAELNLKGDFELCESLDLLERPIEISAQIQPWQIRTYKLKKKRASGDTLK
ncbi:MAG TPA: alpha-mannosidase, partial [Leptolyngbya sp.]|nr:alpha-mannosidase [Leptolyngbya sp.]